MYQKEFEGGMAHGKSEILTLASTLYDWLRGPNIFRFIHSYSKAWSAVLSDIDGATKH